MKNFPPNLDPKIYNISAVIIGFALIDDFTAAEQNAIGNWFITIGQILENNSAWQQVIESRIMGNSININSKKYRETGNPYTDVKEWVKSPMSEELDKIKDAIMEIKKELDNLK